MAAQKESMPSFASIISVLSIVFYCAGFLRVELELHEQKKRINALESVAEAKSLSNDPDVKIIKIAPGKCASTQARVDNLHKLESKNTIIRIKAHVYSVLSL